MESFETTLESSYLNEDLELIVYGRRGVPFIVFPTFDFSAGSWETAGMIEELSELIDAGRIQLFCTDSVDGSSWYAHGADLAYRAERQSAFLNYVQQELLPYVLTTSASSNEKAQLASHSPQKPILAGCGAGATNATAALLQHPELYGGLLALSGAFDARFYSDGFTNDEWLVSSPVDLVQKLSEQQCKTLDELPLAFVCGQSPDETGAETMRHMDELMAQLGIRASFEYWGFDVSHTWYWWKKMASELVPLMLERAGLATRRQLALMGLVDAAEAKLDDMKSNAKQRLEEEARAKRRVATIAQEVEEKTKIYETAVASAEKLWAKRNELAAELASLDQKAAALQEEADRAKHAQQEAEWFAGEARNNLQVATTSRLAAEARVSAAQKAADRAHTTYENATATVKHFKTEPVEPTLTAVPTKTTAQPKTTQSAKVAAPTKAQQADQKKQRVKKTKASVLSAPQKTSKKSSAKKA